MNESSFQLIIEATEAAKKRKRPQKTTEFSATLLAHLSAADWWEQGSTGENVRPVWMLLAGTERSLRPVVANLRLGRRAGIYRHNGYTEYRGQHVAWLECLRSVPAQVLWQRETGHQVGPLAFATWYQPSLFQLDPGQVDPEAVQFLSVCPRWWSDAQRDALADADAAAVAAHLQALLAGNRRHPWAQHEVAILVHWLPWAVYTVAYLEKRTTRPLVNSAGFYLQVFLAGLERGIFRLAWPVDAGKRAHYGTPVGDGWDWARAHSPTSFALYRTPAAGIEWPVGCQAPHTVLDPFLADQVARYFHAQARVAPSLQRAA